jgi:hypothetical protein
LRRLPMLVSRETVTATATERLSITFRLNIYSGSIRVKRRSKRSAWRLDSIHYEEENVRRDSCPLSRVRGSVIPSE